MNPRETICAIVFLLFSEYSLCQTGCVSPRPGRCSRDNYSINSNEVCGLNAGTCNMDINGLCSYQQGCADPNMSHWTQVGGAAQAHQTGMGTCGGEFYYSVLESPWLQFTHESSCLTFTYIRTAPAALDVYLEYRGGSLLTVLEKDRNSDNNQITQVVRTVDAGTAKVLFRAYGGGGGGHVNVHSVSVKTGLCTWAGALYVTSVSTDVKQWTSPLLSPTEPDTMDCISFTYTLSNSAGSRLTVSVQPLGDNTAVTVWRDSNGTEAKIDGKCPLQVSGLYKIVFEMEASSTSSSNDVVVTWFRQSLKAEECLLTPESAVTSDSNKVVTSSVPNQPYAAAQCSSQPLPTTLRTSTVSSKSLPTPDDPKTSDVAAIGGGVAAAVIVIIIIIVVVIIVIVVRRRRRLEKNDNNERTTAVNRGAGSTPDDVVTPSIYDRPGELSRPNHYGRLQATTPNFSAPTATSTAPSADISMTEAASYYNVGGNGQSAVSFYQNIGDPVTSANDDDETNYYEQM